MPVMEELHYAVCYSQLKTIDSIIIPSEGIYVKTKAVMQYVHCGASLSNMELGVKNRTKIS